jgi:trehalose-6-phosphate synthase
MPNGVEFEGRLAHVGTFPIGIDPTSFTKVRLLFHSRCEGHTLTEI